MSSWNAVAILLCHAPSDWTTPPKGFATALQNVLALAIRSGNGTDRCGGRGALADKNEEAKAKAELDIAALSHTCGSCHASVYSLLTVGSGGGYVTVDGGSVVSG